MTKEINCQVVKEVEDVLRSIDVEVENGRVVTSDLFNSLQSKVMTLINDYNATLENFSACNSLVVKYEKYFEVIGSIENSFVFEPKILDETLEKLSTIDTIQK